MAKFRSTQYAVPAHLATEFTPAEVNDFRRQFGVFDQNGDGKRPIYLRRTVTLVDRYDDLERWEWVGQRDRSGGTAGMMDLRKVKYLGGMLTPALAKEILPLVERRHRCALSQ
jgi:hypothetical protein